MPLSVRSRTLIPDPTMATWHSAPRPADAPHNVAHTAHARRMGGMHG